MIWLLDLAMWLLDLVSLTLDLANWPLGIVTKVIALVFCALSAGDPVYHIFELPNFQEQS